MYKLISAVKRKTPYNGNWVKFDLGEEKLKDIFKRLGWVVAELKPNGETKGKWINLINLEEWFKQVDQNMTFNQWLEYIGDPTLPFNKEPFKEKSYVKYVQAWHSGYKFEPVHSTMHPSADVPMYDKSDLIVTHPELTPTYIGEYGVFSVNGLFHISYFGPTQLRIIDGFKSVYKYRDNQIGVMSFEQIGKIQCIPIKTEYLSKSSEDARYWDNTFLKIPDTVDLTNQSVFFVIGGYIYFPGSDINAINANSFSIKFNNILTIEKYLQMDSRLDLTYWNLPKDENNPSRIKVEELFKDSTVLKLMTMSQSFMVIVDSPTLYQNIEPVEYIKFPGRYLDKMAYKLPLMGINGIGLDYHTIKEDVVTVLAASNNRRENYIANTMDWTKENYLDNGRYPYRPFDDETAYYRIISN